MKRLLAILLCVVLLGGLIPSPGFAEYGEQGTETAVSDKSEPESFSVNENESASEHDPDTGKEESAGEAPEETVEEENNDTQTDLLGFTLQLQDGVICNGESFVISWELNFIPTQLPADARSWELKTPGVYCLRAWLGDNCVQSKKSTVAAEGEGLVEEVVRSGEIPSGENIPNTVLKKPEADVIQAVMASGVCGENLTWSLEDGVLAIAGTGAMTNWKNGPDVPWFGCRDKIMEIALPEGLTSIEDYAFYNCYNLTSVTIPESVISIGYKSFDSCCSLMSVTIPAGVTNIKNYAFYNCNSLISVTIPEGLSSIGNFVFDSCSSLTSVTIPADVTNIGNSAFSGCISLTSVTIPESVTSVGDCAFNCCSGLKTIIFLGDAPSFGENVFCDTCVAAFYPADNETWTPDKKQNYGGTITWLNDQNPPEIYTIEYDLNGCCDAPLHQIKISGVDLILTSDKPFLPGYAFLGWATDPVAAVAEYACGDSYGIDQDVVLFAVWQELNPGVTVVDGGSCGDGLTWTYYESGLLYISGNGAMTNWNYNSAPWYGYRENITEVFLPEGLTTVGSYAFHGCKYVTGLTIPKGVINIENHAFYHCSSLTSVEIPSEVLSIGSAAFDGCNSLASVTIPASVTNIGEFAFSDCSSLTNVIIPSGVTSIGAHAFNNCGSLMSVTILSGQMSIGREAFAGCYALTDVYIETIDAWCGISHNYPGTSFCSAKYNLFVNGELVTDLVIPDGVDGIRQYAFENCNSLSRVTPAPSFAADCFRGTAAEIRYPADQPGWDAAKDRDYGGTLTWIGYRGEAKAYTVQYDPNGGSEAPADQIKGHGVDLTLSNETLVRDHYTFKGWATDPAAGEAEFAPGSVCALNRDVTLYAVWEPETFTVSFDADGGTGAPAEQTKFYGVTLTLPNTVPTREGFAFLGWGTEQNALTAVYQPGESFTREGDTVLYALWKGLPPATTTDAVLTLTDTTTSPGHEFEIDVKLENNPGLMVLSFRLNYDTELIEYLGGEDGTLRGWTFSNVGALWDGDQDSAETGQVARLRFRVKDDVPNRVTQIHIVELFAGNYNEEIVKTETISSKVVIADGLPGDVNGDGQVTGMDLIRLRKYLAGDNVEIDLSNADVNGDGKVTGMDLIRLRKYLAGADVELQ